MTGATLAAQIADRLNRFLRHDLGAAGPIALHEPWIGEADRRRVLECLESGWVSTAGPWPKTLEGELAGLTDRAYAVATITGTAAQHVLLTALGIGAGDLVVCPTISFAATANAIRQAGADPLFVDVDPTRLSLDPDLLTALFVDECEATTNGLRHRPTGRRVAAVIAVDVFGHPADWDRLGAVTDRHKVTLLADAAESLGSRWQGRPCGAFGRAAILSFNGNKIATAGGGGAVVTDDAALAARVLHLANTAKIPHDWSFEHDEAGFNYRMPSLNAALCLGQLENLDRKLALKRQLQGRYRDLFADEPAVQLIDDGNAAVGNFWLCALLWPDATAREDFLAACHAHQIRARACWKSLPELPMYRAAPRAATGVARGADLSARIANLPSSPQLLAGRAS